jgi:hypothetical protein
MKQMDLVSPRKATPTLLCQQEQILLLVPWNTPPFKGKFLLSTEAKKSIYP